MEELLPGVVPYTHLRVSLSYKLCDWKRGTAIYRSNCAVWGTNLWNNDNRVMLKWLFVVRGQFYFWYTFGNVILTAANCNSSWGRTYVRVGKLGTALIKLRELRRTCPNYLEAVLLKDVICDHNETVGETRIHTPLTRVTLYNKTVVTVVVPFRNHALN